MNEDIVYLRKYGYNDVHDDYMYCIKHGFKVYIRKSKNSYLLMTDGIEYASGRREMGWRITLYDSTGRYIGVAKAIVKTKNGKDFLTDAWDWRGELIPLRSNVLINIETGELTPINKGKEVKKYGKH